MANKSLFVQPKMNHLRLKLCGRVEWPVILFMNVPTQTHKSCHVKLASRITRNNSLLDDYHNCSIMFITGTDWLAPLNYQETITACTEKVGTGYHCLTGSTFLHIFILMVGMLATVKYFSKHFGI